MEIEFTSGLPCTHLRPASMTDHFDELIITGTRAMSGSAATRLRNSTIAFSESIRPSSMLTSMIWAPFATWSRATASAAAKSPAVISLRNLAEPVTLVRSPTLTKGMSLVSVKGSRPDSRISGGTFGTRARLHARHRVGDRPDVLRRRTAAAADHVEEPLFGEAAELRRHRFGAFVVAAELVGQPGIGIGADEGVGHAGDLCEMRAHGVGAERAIEADRERPGVAHRVPEGGRRLARQGAAGEVGDGAGDHDRQAGALLRKNLLAGEDGRLGVQRVEDRLDQNDLGAAVDQAAQLLAIGNAQVVEGDGAVAGIVHVGRDGRRAVGRPERAGDEAPAAVLARGDPGRLASDLRAFAVQFVDQRLQAVIGLRDRGRRERVGLDDVGAGAAIIQVDGPDRLRLGERQEIVVALQVAVAAARVPIAAKMLLPEAEALDLRPHRAVEDEDALARRRRQGGEHFGAIDHAAQ